MPGCRSARPNGAIVAGKRGSASRNAAAYWAETGFGLDSYSFSTSMKAKAGLNRSIRLANDWASSRGGLTATTYCQSENLSPARSQAAFRLLELCVGQEPALRAI